jgi:hypothetical protein
MPQTIDHQKPSLLLSLCCSCLCRLSVSIYAMPSLPPSLCRTPVGPPLHHCLFSLLSLPSLFHPTFPAPASASASALLLDWTSSTTSTGACAAGGGVDAVSVCRCRCRCRCRCVRVSVSVSVSVSLIRCQCQRQCLSVNVYVALVYPVCTECQDQFKYLCQCSHWY